MKAQTVPGGSYQSHIQMSWDHTRHHPPHKVHEVKIIRATSLSIVSQSSSSNNSLAAHSTLVLDMAKEKTLILVEKSSNGIAIITLNRPQALNALSPAMLVTLASTFTHMDEDSNVKVIILTGVGRAFSAGIDLTAAADVFQGDVKNEDYDTLVQMQKCRKPIIGAINGLCITAGFEIALGCDILVASTAAKFIDTHAKFGIFPSWGLSQRLQRAIGPYRAREVSLTATPLDAQTAEKWGLVNRVVAPSELLRAARGIAEAILKNQDLLVVKYKAVINDGFKLPLGDALKLEQERGHEYYANMKPEEFAAMQEFISGRSSRPKSKL